MNRDSQKPPKKSEITILPSWKYSHSANCIHGVWTCITPHSWLHRRELSHSCEEVMYPHTWMLQELAFFPALLWNSWSEPQSSQGSVPNVWACVFCSFKSTWMFHLYLENPWWFCIPYQSCNQHYVSFKSHRSFYSYPGWCLVCCAGGWLHSLRLGPVFEPLF